MHFKNLFCIIAIIFISACGAKEAEPEYSIIEAPAEEEPAKTDYESKEVIIAETISLSEFKSEFNSFGNTLNGNAIAYDSTSECYYLSQPFYYEEFIKGPANILSCLSSISADFSSCNLLTETGADSIVVNNGKIFFREYCLGNGYDYYSIRYRVSAFESNYQDKNEKPAIRPIVTLNENYIPYYIDNNAIYYSYSENKNTDTYKDNFYFKVIEEKFSGSEPETILDGCKFFQVIGENLFYLGCKGIYQLNLNTKKSKFILCRNDINSFIIDGFLVYKDISGGLYLENGNYIDSDVMTYNIYKDKIFYSTQSGLFAYSILDMSKECILSMDNDNREILAINICNDQIFLSMHASESKNASVKNTSLFILDPKNGCFQSVNSYYPDYHSFRYVYNSSEDNYRAYEVSYPVGFMLYNDIGSSYSRVTTIWSPEQSNISINVGSIPFIDLDTDAEKIPLTTYKGEKGYYVCYEKEDMHYKKDFLYFDFILSESCALSTATSVENRDYIIPILLEMSKTLHEYKPQ